MTKVLALTIPKREMMIRCARRPTAWLEELRAVLLREHVGRVRDGLVWSGSSALSLARMSIGRPEEHLQAEAHALGPFLSMRWAECDGEAPDVQCAADPPEP